LRKSSVSWEKVATEEYEAAEEAEGDRRWRFDDEAEAAEGDPRWPFDDAEVLFMVDGVVLICDSRPAKKNGFSQGGKSGGGGFHVTHGMGSRLCVCQGKGRH
jgi:hypothetical protein